MEKKRKGMRCRPTRLSAPRGKPKGPRGKPKRLPQRRKQRQLGRPLLLLQQRPRRKQPRPTGRSARRRHARSHSARGQKRLRLPEGCRRLKPLQLPALRRSPLRWRRRRLLLRTLLRHMLPPAPASAPLPTSASPPASAFSGQVPAPLPPPPPAPAPPPPSRAPAPPPPAPPPPVPKQLVALKPVSPHRQPSGDGREQPAEGVARRDSEGAYTQARSDAASVGHETRTCSASKETTARRRL